jgi:ribonuclease Z
MMESWVELEEQRTPHEIIPLGHGEQYESQEQHLLRAVEMNHTVPANGYALIERRSKLRDEFFGLPQDRLRELKNSGVEITRTLEIPLIAYTGDTEMCPNLFSDEFANAKVVITECTFFEEDHRSRSTIGKHLHLDDLANLLNVWQAEHVILVHLSRRTNLIASRTLLNQRLGEENASRIHFLMDYRTNASGTSSKSPMRKLVPARQSDVSRELPPPG